MAEIERLVPGIQVRIRHSPVARVAGKVGVIVETKRIKRNPADPIRDRIVVDVPGHGDIELGPEDLEIVA